MRGSECVELVLLSTNESQHPIDLCLLLLLELIVYVTDTWLSSMVRVGRRVHMAWTDSGTIVQRLTVPERTVWTEHFTR